MGNINNQKQIPAIPPEIPVLTIPIYLKTTMSKQNIAISKLFLPISFFCPFSFVNNDLVNSYPPKKNPYPGHSLANVAVNPRYKPRVPSVRIISRVISIGELKK
jgi:hypothetical protein